MLAFKKVELAATVKQMVRYHHAKNTKARDLLLDQVQRHLLVIGSTMFWLDDLLVLVRLTYRGSEIGPMELAFMADGIIEYTPSGWYIAKNRRGRADHAVVSWNDMLRALNP